MKMSAIETTGLPPGATVQHYAVIDAIGSDEQYTVYRAECSRSLRSVVLYEYRPGRAVARGATGVRPARGRGDSLERALAAQADRLRAASAVDHPALPVLEEIWQQDGTLYAVGPWQAGRCLLTAMTTGASAIGPETVLAWAGVLGEALDALHRQGLVHGNISPSTTRLLADGRLVLPPVGGPVLDELAPAWVAPEQHPLNPRPAGIGPWTDIYQLSALLHQAITGLPPPAVTRRWEGAPLERLSGSATAWPDPLLQAVRQGLSMIPSARPLGIPAWFDKAQVPPARPLPVAADAADPTLQAAPAGLQAQTDAADEAIDAGPTDGSDDRSAGASMQPGPEPVLQSPAEPTPALPSAAEAPASGPVGPATSHAALLAMPDDASAAEPTPAATAVEALPVTADEPARHAAQDADVIDVKAQTVTRRAPPGTPAWVWVAAALSVAGVVGIVIAT